MASTRDIRRRIKSVKNTAQITRAMQMVAASKMNRAQQAALAGKSYAYELNRMLKSIRRALEESKEKVEHPFFEKRPDTRPLVVFITTDKGLCGALNTNLFKEASSLPAHTEFVSIGRKGKQFLGRTQRRLIADFDLKENVQHSEIKPVVQFLIERYLNKGPEQATSIRILYPDFVNTLVQRPRLLQLLPIESLSSLEAKTALDPHQQDAHTEASEASAAEAQASTQNSPHHSYLFEPSPLAILEQILPYYIDFTFYQIMLDARAAEHSARMVAMKSASDNAKEIIRELTLEYNKARQASITNEILEISSSQLALNQ